ncbi:hypothetical protein [Runella slithyformis]|uniref:Uncharacterized protein n=1 Tax=Runella slithyformis (strain ATCC 29530 / DSM 19594 / LMG 11500 / NCIMB 11436 / LSU 4) TaxID=761193 RepID=A0A7U3ZGK8_RUNSL|nr:hypothetical protein [Runella slithyformis]AEI46765.1 hypothetical protein Runsl_0313 [Runella slithyformis DSM 19594]
MYQKTKVLKAKKAPKRPAERKPLNDEQRAEQRAKASCCILVEFYQPITLSDGRTITNLKKWSNEWQQPHKGDLNDWVNELMRIFDIYWKIKAKSAAIFDTRFQKTLIGSERDPDCNKLYQFENRVWRAVK